MLLRVNLLPDDFFDGRVPRDVLREANLSWALFDDSREGRIAALALAQVAHQQDSSLSYFIRAFDSELECDLTTGASWLDVSERLLHNAGRTVIVRSDACIVIVDFHDCDYIAVGVHLREPNLNRLGAMLQDAHARFVSTARTGYPPRAASWLLESHDHYTACQSPFHRT